ncbi:protein-lysine N-methyltransferase SMYD4-like [Anticarsia gemmatalis]|uniref:protein-lysine N-methyltransferase SMYD4-like n=1 Tax=Anticarsia gemmatalis TaxID=129554 RepID=UPI003F76DE82
MMDGRAEHLLEMLTLLVASERKLHRGDFKCSEVETMDYLLGDYAIRETMHMFMDFVREMSKESRRPDMVPEKDEGLALLWKTKGNDLYNTQNYDAAYSAYCTSLKLAREDGQIFPLSLGNRSACLYKLNGFQYAIEDVERAFRHGFPENASKFKLYIRRVECYVGLKRRAEARQCFLEARANLYLIDTNAPYGKAMLTKMSELDAATQALLDYFCAIPRLPPLAELHNGPNPQFQNASASIELVRKFEMGRHVVARELLNRGDVMFIEEPYVVVPVQKSFEYICDGCAIDKINPIPCLVCSFSIYCSVECRQQAWDHYHKYECSGVQMHFFAHLGLGHLGFRVLLRSAREGYPGLLESGHRVESAKDIFDYYKQFDPLQIYEQDDRFLHMFHLMSNLDRMPDEDYLQYAIYAGLLTQYLIEHTNFMEFLDQQLGHQLPTHELHVFSAALIFRSIGQMVMNAHATFSLVEYKLDMFHFDAEAAREPRETRIATAVYPSCSMMNHSCDPNITSMFMGTKLVVRAAREIIPGEPVFNCYGPHYSRQPTLLRRKELLQQYKFLCTCAACLDRARGDFVMLFSAYSCQSCRGPVISIHRGEWVCQQCSSELDLSRALHFIDKTKEVLASATKMPTPELCVERALSALRMSQQVYHRHNTALRCCASKVAILLAEAGEFKQSLEILRGNLQSQEYQFGSFSVEVAHELRKLASIALRRVTATIYAPDASDNIVEASNIVTKATRLFDLYYGPWGDTANYLFSCEYILNKLPGLIVRRQPGAPPALAQMEHVRLMSMLDKLKPWPQLVPPPLCPY